MSVDKDFVLRALLQHNFLPTQKRDKEELPPIFASVAFTPDVAKKLVAGRLRKVDGHPGYDAVDYKLTRFNGVSRSCSIPHPVAYARLALCIHEHWDKLHYIATNKNSFIRPRQHTDGRVITMDYEKSFEKTKRNLRLAFGRRFMVHTDISNFFPSVYSHAISWAAVGFAHAKKHKHVKYKGEWFNQLDERTRLLKRGETQGVAIGPATSNIVSEAILARVDEVLGKEFSYVRYIDDYTAYCLTEDEAQDFVRRLAQELAQYKLLLNINKTQVVPLPQALVDNWVSQLALALPRHTAISGYDAANFLNLAVQIANKSPDGSVLKYALKALLGRKFEFMVEFDVLRFGLTLAFHQTALLPLLDPLFERTILSPAFPYGNEVHRLALENGRFRRSDGMAWTLYYLNKFRVSIENDLADAVLASGDCIALVLLYLSGNPSHQAKVIAFVKALDSADLYELDQYWLLLYHLFSEGKIASPYGNEDAFEIMRDCKMSFVLLPEINLDQLRARNLARILEQPLGNDVSTDVPA